MDISPTGYTLSLQIYYHTWHNSICPLLLSLLLLYNNKDIYVLPAAGPRFGQTFLWSFFHIVRQIVSLVGCLS